MPKAPSRWWLLWLALALVSFGAAAAGAARAKRARQREAAYQSALRSYSEVLLPGMSRTQVEEFLRRGDKPFRQMCCMGPPKNAWDDLIKIGEESAPWYCSQHNVYVGFEFISSGTHRFAEAHDTDSLKRVTLFHWFEGCL